MAFCILINKIAETSEWVDYEFWEDENKVGSLRLDKKTEEITELRKVEAANSEAVFTRASWRIAKHFAAGEFPDQTSWAS